MGSSTTTTPLLEKSVDFNTVNASELNFPDKRNSLVSALCIVEDTYQGDSPVSHRNEFVILLPVCQNRCATETIPRQRDPDRSIEDRIWNTIADIVRVMIEIEIRDSLRAGASIVLEILGIHAAAVFYRIEQARRAVVFGPALVNNTVTHHAFSALGPGCHRRFSVVRIVPNVTNLSIARGVEGRKGGRCGSLSACQRWRVRVEDDLVPRLHPAIVPLDDTIGFFPAGFGLPALIRIGGGDDKASCIFHD